MKNDLSLKDQVLNAKSLDELTDLLNEIVDKSHENENFYEDPDIDYSDLPVFSKHDVKDTQEVYSWDDTRILVAADNGWALEERCKTCGEATFHCNHN